MKILVTGGSGLIGTALVRSLQTQGHELTVLTRRAGQHRHAGVTEVEWHPAAGELDVARLAGHDAAVHLAGEPIAEGRWTDEKKQRIRDSRVQSTRLLSETLARLTPRPRVLVSASATGYYGDRGDEVLTETSAPGADFLAHVCREWEAAADAARAAGIRVVHPRTGVVLSTDGGALAKMLPPFKLGVGGRIGSGTQYMSWLALADMVGALEYALTQDTLTGPVNFVAPEPVTNAAFTQALGQALNRPTFLPVPAFGVRLMFGELADALLLASQRVVPTQLEAAGYQFKFPQLDAALRHVLHD